MKITKEIPRQLLPISMDINRPRTTSFGEYCEVSSCNGIVDWYRANHLPGKTFWTVILTICFGLTIWQTYGTVDEFASSSPYKITVSKEAKEDAMQYPDIVVCNFNRAKQSLIERDNISSKVLAYVFQLFPTTYDIPPLLFADMNVSSYDEAWQHFSLKKNLTPLDFLSVYGHSAEETFMKISYNGDIISFQPKHLEEFFTRYGRCWKVKLNSKQGFPGATAGIKMILNPQLDEYMKDTIQNNYLQEGLVISVSYVNEPSISQPLFLAPGFSASISLKAVENTVLIPNTPIRKPHCNNDATLLFLNETYSPQNCVHDCFLKAVYDKCGCIYLGRTKKYYPFCNATVISKCALSLSNVSLTWSAPLVKNFVICQTKCLQPCYPYKTVETAMTIAKYPSRASAAAMKQFFLSRNLVTSQKMEELLNSVIAVDIYFLYAEVYASETSESIPIFEFIGNLGGQLGLWTGISMISIVQVLYYLLVGCVKDFWRRMKAKTSRCKKATNIDGLFRVTHNERLIYTLP